MTYVVPQVQVFQEFQTVAQPGVRPLNAHVSGGHAFLVRFSEASEQALGDLGYYDPLTDTCYDWPNRPVGSVIDQDYATLWIKDALLQYHQDVASGGYGLVQTVSGYQNRVRSDTVNYKANGTSYPRHASLIDRDVTLGDVAKVRAVVGMDVYTLWTYVAGFVADTVAASIAAATADGANQGTIGSSSATPAQTGGAENCVDISAASAASYNGLPDGNPNEVYTVRVIEGSVGGDFTTARLRITSASGNDDVASVAPEASGNPTNIGSRGLTATFLYDAQSACSVSAVEEGVSDEDLVVGQEWEITVAQVFTAPTATSGGTYTGPSDTTYIVEVTRGGFYADSVKPQITVTTDNGIDVSGPTNVTAAASAVAIGVHGATIQFNQTALCKGDKYYVTATAATAGGIKTLILGHNLDANISAGTDVDITLYIRKTIEVSKNRTGFAPQVNWSSDEDQICLQDGIIAYDATWTDSGVPQALPVISESTQGFGRVYVEYRAWLATLATDVYSIDTVGSLDTEISGPLDPDNPLKWAVFKALANSNGTAVKYTAVADPSDIDSWTNVIDLIDGRTDVYGLVPLTYDQTVLDLFVAHVNAQSNETFNRWRVLWTSLENPAIKAVVNATVSTDNEEVKATISDNPNVSGTQYTLVQVPAGNGRFVTNGVRAGDIVRGLYTTDGFGGSLYTEFIVASVINEDALLLTAGHTSAISVAQKIEVWRNLTVNEQAAELAAKAGAYGNRRVRAVWPDELSSGGTLMAGYHLCAALSGLTSGVVPHQGLTHLEISGFDDVSRTNRLFSRTQRDVMAGGGVWIVEQDVSSGAIITRHAVTTGDTDDINQREEQITRNLDSISYLFLEAYEPYIGVSNVTPEMRDILEAETKARIQFLRGNNYVERLGGQLIDAEIRRIEPSLIFKDRFVIELGLVMPYPTNNIDLHLVV